MAANTYEAIATQTLVATAATVTFSSIPSTYTDLILVANNVVSTRTSSQDLVTVQFNLDTGTNYSAIELDGSSGGASSTRWTNEISAIMGFVSDGNSTANPSLFPSQFTLQIQNYSNSTTYKTLLSRYGENTSNITYTRTGAHVGLWRSNTAINTITLGLYYASYAAGSSFSLYGVKAASATSPKATGGTIYEDSTYWIHAFGTSGTFTPSQALTVDYLVVAGGGGGGSLVTGGPRGNGGGGAGGYRTTVGTSGGGGSAESQLSLSSGVGYTVTIGAGGAGGVGVTAGSNGSNSVFSTITSIGGGRGNDGSVNPVGQSGGSGGGTYPTYSPGGAGTANQGFAGGAGSPTDGNNAGAGGGGGAGSVGQIGYLGSSLSTGTGGGGNGGAGLISAIDSIARAGGGGGGRGGIATAGGGNGGDFASNGFPAVAGTGGGGGGTGTQNGVNYTGGAGGSGIVLIRYLKA